MAARAVADRGGAVSARAGSGKFGVERGASHASGGASRAGGGALRVGGGASRASSGASRTGDDMSRAGASRAGGVSHVRVVEIQRARLLAAAMCVIDELGYVDTTVAHITACARVSRRTFYELFADREACLAAVLEDVLTRIERELAAADLGELAWRERVRGALWVILSFLDREPVLARVCVVQALRAGPRVLERREGILAQLAGVVDEGRGENARASRCPALTAEGLVGAGFSIVYARLLRGERAPLAGLLGELMGMILLPYLGPGTARREQTRPLPVSPAGTAHRSGGLVDSGDPLGGVAMRLTYRTARALESVGEYPGACNREVGERAGIIDPGQISKLMRRLERLDLVVNRGGGRRSGEANAWELTALGSEVTQRLSLKPQSTYANDKKVRERLRGS
jgi:AcrR family transcriptional regulator